MKVCLALALVLWTAASLAQADVVAFGVTRPGSTGGINAKGHASSIAAPHSAYASDVTEPHSEWVWVGDVNSVNRTVFEFRFDLTGYDLGSANLNGIWGVDNFGKISVNGSQIAEMTGNTVTNYSNLHPYGSSRASDFRAGWNTVLFEMGDGGGPGGFRATVVVTADRQ